MTANVIHYKLVQFGNFNGYGVNNLNFKEKRLKYMADFIAKTGYEVKVRPLKKGCLIEIKKDRYSLTANNYRAVEEEISKEMDYHTYNRFSNICKYGKETLN